MLVTLAEIRDIVVVVYGAMGVILMLALAIAAFGIWFAVRALTRALTALLDDPVKPTLYEVQKTVENVRGTSEFIADSTVHPIIRTIAVFRGVRRGFRTAASFRRRGSR